MKTKKTTLFTTLAFALLMSLGTAMYAHIDDPIVDPDLVDRPRVSLQTISNGLAERVPAKVLQQGGQVMVVFEQPAGVVAVVVQAADGKTIYTGTVNTNAVPAVSFSAEEEDANK
jgi:hypothetical protein